MNSLEIAKIINKRHSAILKIIKGTSDRYGLIEILTNTKANIDDYFIESTYIDAKGENRLCYDCTKLGCYLIRDKIRGRQKDLLTVELQELFKDEAITLTFVDRKEIEFINQLEEALEPFNIKGERQYPVLNYRIDYYIPELNIAIEYDENDHKNYSYESHEGRQLKIEQTLGCRFIRVSDSKTNTYNIGYVIKMILKP